MLHILWLIIKWILILLGIVLALLLLILAAILFCPLRYSGEGIKEGKDYSLQGKLSWLLGAVSLKVFYGRRKEPQIIFRIFGIPADRCRGLFRKKRKKEKKHQEIPEKKMSENEDSVSKKMPEDTGIESTEATKTISEKKISKADTQKQVSEKDGRKNPEPDTLEDQILSGIKAFLKKLLGIPKKLWEAAAHFPSTIQKMYGRIKKAQEFLENERTKAVARLLWEDTRKLFRHIMPRKIRGWISFGTGDPAHTGQLLAVLGVTAPLHKNALAVYPDFEQKILEGEIRLKGRIYGITLLIIGWELYRNPDVRMMIKKFKEG